MNIFEKLLEIKTGKIDLDIKMIHIDKLDSEKFLSYCSYYYNKTNHSLYINWLDNSRLSKRDILEKIINKAYEQELNLIVGGIETISKIKKPNVFLFHYSKNKELVIIDTINIKAIRNKELEIKKLKVWI